MTDQPEAKQATPHSQLISELMDSRVPKTEREHAAAREIERLRAALEQQEQAVPVAPYAWMAVGGTIWRRKTSEDDVPLYTHPPRQWRGLKEWEINDGRDQLPTEDLCSWSFRQGVYFAEKALKERNNG
jgi:hypothetical protein